MEDNIDGLGSGSGLLLSVEAISGITNQHSVAQSDSADTDGTDSDGTDSDGTDSDGTDSDGTD